MSLGFVTWTIKIIFRQYNYMDLHKIWNSTRWINARLDGYGLWRALRMTYANEMNVTIITGQFDRVCVCVSVCWKSIMQHKVWKYDKMLVYNNYFAIFSSNNIRIVCIHIKEMKFFKANIIIIKLILSLWVREKETKKIDKLCDRFHFISIHRLIKFSAWQIIYSMHWTNGLL